MGALAEHLEYCGAVDSPVMCKVARRLEPYVESAESAGRAGSKLHEIFAEGITVSRSDRLDALRKEVVADE